jgi:hypothetical protein
MATCLSIHPCMKNKTLLLIVALFLIAVQPSFGAFPAKHASTAKSIEITNRPAPDYVPGKTNRFSANISHLIPPFDGDHHKPHHKRIGSYGLLSFIFGILSLSIIASFFSIPAIILGIMGIRHRKKYSRTGKIFSILGLSFGILVVVFFLILALTFD